MIVTLLIKNLFIYIQNTTAMTQNIKISKNNHNENVNKIGVHKFSTFSLILCNSVRIPEHYFMLLLMIHKNISQKTVVMGDHSCSKGRGFESQHHILDGHLDIFHIDWL